MENVSLCVALCCGLRLLIAEESHLVDRRQTDGRTDVRSSGYWSGNFRSPEGKTDQSHSRTGVFMLKKQEGNRIDNYLTGITFTL